jgi:hypothetical protein
MCTDSATEPQSKELGGTEPVRSCTRVDKTKKHYLACSFYSLKGKLILVSIRALNSSPAKEYMFHSLLKKFVNYATD